MARQERAERTREVVVRAAAVCFDTAGFAATSLSDVVATAAVSKGALYFHFASKEKLAEAVAAQSAAGWREVLRAVGMPGAPGAGPDAPAPPVMQGLIDITHALARRVQQDVVFRAGLRLCEEYLPGARGARPDPYPSWRRCVSLRLARAGRRGELRPGVDLADAARVLSAATAGVEKLSRRDAAWLSPSMIAGVWRALLPALVPAADLERLRPSGLTPLPGPRHTPPGPGSAAPAPPGGSAVGTDLLTGAPFPAETSDAAAALAAAVATAVGGGTLPH